MLTKSRIAALLLTVLAPWAQASVVTSGDGPCSVTTPQTRVFSVKDSAVGCLYIGMGNINGTVQPHESEGADNLMLGAGWTYVPSATWLTLTPTEPGKRLLGSFGIESTAYETYSNFAIGFKTGNGGLDPDFAIFELESGVLEGSWSISGQQALSRVILWGKASTASVFDDPLTRLDPPGGTGDSTNNVPEPASLALVGLGLLGAAASRRRRGSRQA